MPWAVRFLQKELARLRLKPHEAECMQRLSDEMDRISNISKLHNTVASWADFAWHSSINGPSSSSKTPQADSFMLHIVLWPMWSVLENKR